MNKAKSAKSTKAKKQYVLIRTYSAGVHCGYLEARKGKEVVLSAAKRIWSWTGANTLHEISLRGVSSGSRISDPVDKITLTEAIEIIPCTKDAQANLEQQLWLK